MKIFGLADKREVGSSTLPRPIKGKALDVTVGGVVFPSISILGIAAMTTRVDALADSFYARYSQRLFINDMSLPYGGVFDTASNWIPPHSEHRSGRDVDVRTNVLTEGQKQYIRRKWVGLQGDPHIETTHLHLRYRGQE